MSAFSKEKETQNRVVKLFCDTLGYTYLGDRHDRNNANIEQNYLKKYLQKAGIPLPLSRRRSKKLQTWQ